MFSLRVLALVTFFGELKVMWSKTAAAYQMFANPPGNSTGLAARYLTNTAARVLAPGEQTGDYTAHAAPEFDRLKAGMWEDCIAPQLKVALVAHMLGLLSEPRNFTQYPWYENLGCDFLIDENFKAHFLECNCWAGCADGKKHHLFQDMYRIVFDEAVRHSEKPGQPGSAPKGYEVLLDVAARYAFRSPSLPQHCSALG